MSALCQKRTILQTGMLRYRVDCNLIISEEEDRMPVISRWLRVGAASVALTASVYGALPARATDVIAEWATIQMPASPALKPVTVDPKSTALLMLDFMT